MELHPVIPSECLDVHGLERRDQPGRSEMTRLIRVPGGYRAAPAMNAATMWVACRSRLVRPDKHGWHFDNTFVNELLGGPITTKGCGLAASR